MDKTSIELSPIIVGTMRLGEWGAKLSTADLQSFVEGCLEMGLQDFDHADIYGHYSTEAEFGEMLKHRSSLRTQLRITTKCGIKMMTPRRSSHKIKSYDSSTKHIISSVENSLRDLATDYIDILLLHRPDYLGDPAEIAECIEMLKSQGKIRAFGVSNYSASQFELLHSYTQLFTNQIEVSITQREALDNGVLDQCMRLGVTPTAWSPLGGGALFQKEKSDSLISIHDKATAIAERHNCAVDTLIYAWLLKHPVGIIPVIGTSKLTRVASAKAATSIDLSHEEWYELLASATGHEVA